MNNLLITSAVLGTGLAASILYLVRRDHLYLRDGLFWIAVALVSVVLGIWPSLIDLIGRLAGVAYAPALILLLATVALIVRALLADIAVTQMRRELRRLNQRIALIETAIADKDRTSS